MVVVQHLHLDHIHRHQTIRNTAPTSKGHRTLIENLESKKRISGTILNNGHIHRIHSIPMHRLGMDILLVIFLFPCYLLHNLTAVKKNTLLTIKHLFLRPLHPKLILLLQLLCHHILRIIHVGGMAHLETLEATGIVVTAVVQVLTKTTTIITMQQTEGRITPDRERHLLHHGSLFGDLGLWTFLIN
jgi:hypothetical protein